MEFVGCFTHSSITDYPSHVADGQDPVSRLISSCTNSYSKVNVHNIVKSMYFTAIIVSIMSVYFNSRKKKKKEGKSDKLHKTSDLDISLCSFSTGYHITCRFVLLPLTDLA